jgi:hypothetical protein
VARVIGPAGGARQGGPLPLDHRYKAAPSCHDPGSPERPQVRITASRGIEAMVRPSAGTDLVLRAASLEDCRPIAELFEISSDGIADYV